MFRAAQFILLSLLLVGSFAPHANADSLQCEDLFVPVDEPQVARGSYLESVLSEFKKMAISKTLDVMAYMKGLPKYLKLNEQLKQSGRYLQYRNFGEMGLAETGVAARYNLRRFEALNTGRPLIIVGNHHLGISDGLALQYIAGRSRTNTPSLLYLARWVEKLLPHAVFGDAHKWGTAVPVEINKPDTADPLYEKKMADLKAFNSSWSRTSLRVLKSGGALIIFPAGHVASINKDGGAYPGNVYDAPGSWMDSALSLARLGKADIVFAHVDSVNSEAFYTKRKRFGGGDKERIVWFFSEAIGKRGHTIDVHLSDPMSLDAVYNTLAHQFGHSRETLEADPALTAELMRQYTYQVSKLFPQQLDTRDLPQKIPDSPR